MTDWDIGGGGEQSSKGPLIADGGFTRSRPWNSDGAASKKCILLVNDGGRFSEDDGNGIETDLVPSDTGTGHIASSGTDDAVLLFAVDGTVGAAELSRKPRFHLDKNQRAVVASNDVDFGFSGTGPVISGDNHKARVSQVAVRQIFAATAERGIGR